MSDNRFLVVAVVFIVVLVVLDYFDQGDRHG